MRYISIFILLSFLSAGCNEDSFSKVVEFDIDEEDQELVVLAFIKSDSPEPVVVVSRTTSVTAPDRFPYISDAMVQLETPDLGILVGQFKESEDAVEPDIQGTGFYVFPAYEFLPNEEYVLTVSHPEFDDVSASVTTQSIPKMQGNSIRIDDTFEFHFMEFYDVVIEDNPDEENYYKFDLFLTTFENGQDTFTYNSSIWFDENELIDGDINLLSDVNFINNRKEIVLIGDNFFGENTEVIKREIKITSYGSELASYLQSLNLAYTAEENPFVEPAILYTNIENGLGIFSVGVSSSIVFE